MKILILSRNVKDYTQARSSVNVISLSIKNALEKIKDVEVITKNYTDKHLPKVDFVIVVVYIGTDSDRMDFREIKSKTGCKKIVNLRESYLKEADYNYVFNPVNKLKDSKLIKFPAPLQLLKNTQKESKTILIDHYLEPNNTKIDWTNRIVEWVRTVKDEFRVYRMIRFSPKSGYSAKVDEVETIKDFEVPIIYAPYPEYLNITNSIETFIVTHHECYPHSVIDMVARGIRVMSPPNMIPKVMTDELGIVVFHNKQDFINKLKQQINKKNLNTLRFKLLDYDKVGLIMYEDFKGWLND